jgi:hypothetical protein
VNYCAICNAEYESEIAAELCEITHYLKRIAENLERKDGIVNVKENSKS